MDHVKLLCDIGEMSGIFSKSVSIETMLQKIVDLVAEHLSADVCSIYLFDETRQELLLKATKGLHPDSVNKIRLKLGEGIAGFALKEPQTICEKVGSDHPSYKFFPGIFEERYEAFLAVPILRGISKIGVFIVQREKKICFTEQDVMAMRAVASQLGSIAENAKLLMQLDSKTGETKDVENWDEFRFLKGKAASEGFAFSEVILLDNERSFELLLERDFDKAYTLDDFNHALTRSETQLEDLQKAVEEKLSDVASLIFAAHLMVLKDKGFVGKMRQLIMDGENPPLAVKRIAEEYIHMFSQNPSSYIREKVQDIKDLVIRLMQNLVTDSKMTAGFEGRIVIAKELFPSDILRLSSEGIKGIVLASGGVTSHLSILARSLRIPLIIVNVPKLLSIPENTKVLMDAELGNIYINPTDEIISQFRSRNEARLKLMEKKEFMSPMTKTADGTEIKLQANINLLTDLKLANELNADGVGLYRTEFPFLIRSTFPTEEEQFLVYRKLIEGMPGKEITFRTLDIGGDKVLSYFYNEKEQNPFLGMRSIRFSLNNKDIFRQQLRAMLRAGVRAKIRIMFPMISSLDQFLEARDMVYDVMGDLKHSGIPLNEKPGIGMMVEIPSVIDIIDDLGRKSDFFSIGSNDLVQYMLAVDRTNEKVAEFYLPYHPSVLRAIKKVVDAAHRNRISVSVCGDMAHEENLIPFLLGIGLRVLSVDPMYLLRIKKIIARISLKEAKKLGNILLAETRVSAIEEILKKSQKQEIH